MEALRQLCEIKRLRVIGRQQTIVEHLRDLLLLAFRQVRRRKVRNAVDFK